MFNFLKTKKQQFKDSIKILDLTSIESNMLDKHGWDRRKAYEMKEKKIKSLEKQLYKIKQLNF